MRLLTFLLALGLALPAAAQKKQEELPEKWRDAMQERMPREQKIVQTLVGDVDNDGKDEWIAIGESTRLLAGTVSIGIFKPAKGKVAPELRFAQSFRGEGFERAGAVVRSIDPVGNAVVLVAAAPRIDGNSEFTLQIYAWNGERFRPVLPERLTFRSQGGFAIENVDKRAKGDEIVGWTFLQGPNEQLFDHHVYETKIYRWDGIRFVSPDFPSRTAEKMASPDDAAKSLGVTTGDLRRQMPRVAGVP
jgi:hypothetical protein